MAYVEPIVTSSFRGTPIGKSLYDYVKDARPSLILELGVLNGFSSICFLQAIRDVGAPCRLISVDLFEKYDYNSCSLINYLSNVSPYYSTHSCHSVIQSDALRLNYSNLLSTFPEYSQQSALAFVDLSNDATVLKKVFDSINLNILFEGGTSERDDIEWMKLYDKIPIASLLNTDYNYSIVCKDFPSLSLRMAVTSKK